MITADVTTVKLSTNSSKCAVVIRFRNEINGFGRIYKVVQVSPAEWDCIVELIKGDD